MTSPVFKHHAPKILIRIATQKFQNGNKQYFDALAVALGIKVSDYKNAR
ncbi:hypothetical protein Turpa_1614 [Turneriella parva DSM 21527]|uniref:Uncharacterized protein n=1 Tax=Turneriella parva (strain ATCC BAA-1111 / DSM 21527 / NCTC 11395 / H) TaxID=869212 RepID=I4B4Q5_TURPD|nr:hypothetical protein Turpa_1614 [Turneriella parva DSM 21527]